MNEETIRVGVIGCGGFGLFALQQLAQVQGIELTGMAGTHREAAYRAAERFGIPDIQDVGAMVARDDVDLVYISTPPFLHHPQAMKALEAGKHVIVEKPFALTLEQADEMLATAEENDLLVVADLMQRYNPLYESVQKLMDEKPLGEPLHAYFENYAADESLPPDHWFWDREKSGGIFVEHAVHFFDMFAGWFGDGQVLSAEYTLRPGTQIEEQVQCAARYGDTVLVNMYHGFHQPNRMDRQELRIVFERGDVTLYEWIPTRVHVEAVASEKDTRALCEIFPRYTIDVTDPYGGDDRHCRGRHKDLDVYQKLELSAGAGEEKWSRYGQLIRRLARDQVAWIHDRSHERVITGRNGRDSLALALEADRLAHGGK